MSKQEEIRKWIYDKVLAIRTEGIVGGKTKRFAEDDTEEILEYIQSQGVMLQSGTMTFVVDSCCTLEMPTYEPLIEVKK